MRRGGTSVRAWIREITGTEHRFHINRSCAFASMCSTAARTGSPLFKILGRLLCNNKVLQPFENRFTVVEIQTQRLHREFLPLIRRPPTSLFPPPLPPPDPFASNPPAPHLPP